MLPPMISSIAKMHAWSRPMGSNYPYWLGILNGYTHLSMHIKFQNEELQIACSNAVINIAKLWSTLYWFKWQGERTRKLLLIQKEQLKSTINNTPVGIVLEEDEHTYWNRASSTAMEDVLLMVPRVAEWRQYSSHGKWWWISPYFFLTN